MILCNLILLLLINIVFALNSKELPQQQNFNHRPATIADNGIWKKHVEWKARWVKEWHEKMIWVPFWRKVWGPIETNEWIPLPKGDWKKFEEKHVNLNFE